MEDDEKDGNGFTRNAPYTGDDAALRAKNKALETQVRTLEGAITERDQLIATQKELIDGKRQLGEIEEESQETETETTEPEKRMKWYAKLIFATSLLGALGFFVVLIEPMDTHYANGEIIGTELISDPNAPENTNKLNDVKYVYEYTISYLDKIFTVDSSETHAVIWNNPFSRPKNHIPNITNYNRKLYLGPERPTCKCKVKVYYRVGRWFGDPGWETPMVDASDCENLPKDTLCV